MSECTGDENIDPVPPPVLSGSSGHAPWVRQDNENEDVKGEMTMNTIYAVYAILGLMLMTWGLAIWASLPGEET
jgi:hypothetical protein